MVIMSSLTIAVAGLTGSGKNTLGELLAKKLKLRVVCPTFKDLAKREGVSLMEFQKRAEKDPNIDKKFDAELKEQAKNGRCIVTTWLGPWMVDADLRVWVFAPQNIRAARISKRDGMTLEQAERHVRERDERNRQRYLKVYGIDIYNHDMFDLCINNEKITPEQSMKLVLLLLKLRRLKR